MDVDLLPVMSCWCTDMTPPYGVGEIIAYVGDMCQGKTMDVLIYEGAILVWQLAHIPDGAS